MAMNLTAGVTPSPNTIRALRAEVTDIDRRIVECNSVGEQLAARRAQIAGLIETLEQPVGHRTAVHRSNFKLHQGKKSLNGRRQIHANRTQKTWTGSRKKAVVAHRTRKGGNTMDLARQVLQRHGEEMSGAEISDQIRSVFGVKPAKSLIQMLYKRSRKDSSFYRAPDGKYGLVDWRGSRAEAKAA